MDKKGFIYLHRKFLSWEWYDDKNTSRLFIHLLLTANHSTKLWRGIKIKRGELITSSKELSKASKLTVQELKTSLSKLQNTGEINKQTTNKFTKITICNYDSYQTYEKTDQPDINKPSTNEQQTSNKRPTTNNNINNVNNDLYDEKEKKIQNQAEKNDIYSRAFNFNREILEFKEKYSKEMLSNFYYYWTEPNKSKSKMRFELQKTWELSRRLGTWHRNNFDQGKKSTNFTESPEKLNIGTFIYR